MKEESGRMDKAAPEEAKGFRSGFASIIGRPNVGKSTLLNRLLGAKVVITSEKPQTTRNTIKGILTKDDFQIIFLDTPGLHIATTRLNQQLVKSALTTLEEADIVLYMVEPFIPIHSEDYWIIEKLKGISTPVFLIINKVDKVRKQRLLPLIDEFRKLYDFEEHIPISALDGWGVEDMLKAVASRLPEGPRYFPSDLLTDRTERFLAAEFVREKIFRLTGEEIPYCSAVSVEEFREDPEKKLIYIRAVIYVERDNQKGIIIGKGGRMLKEIGRLARQELEVLLGARIYLDLYVKVQKNWRKNSRFWPELGID